MSVKLRLHARAPKLPREKPRKRRGSTEIWRSWKRWSYVKKLCPRRDQAARISAHTRTILTPEVGFLSHGACKKIREKERAAIALMAATVRFLDFIRSHISPPKRSAHSRVLFLSSFRAAGRIVNFITRKKFPPSSGGGPPVRRTVVCVLLFFAKSILSTPAYSSDNRIIPGLSHSLYFRLYSSANARNISFSSGSINARDDVYTPRAIRKIIFTLRLHKY